MFKKQLYKYQDNNKTIVSLLKPECEYEPYLRLIAQSDDYMVTDYNIFTQCIDIEAKNEELWFEVHKDDLETPVSQYEDIKNFISEVNIGQGIQDTAIDATMVALDLLVEEIFMPAARTFSVQSIDDDIPEVKAVKNMVDFYVVMIQRGLKTIDQVPARYREEVAKILEEIEK